MEKLFNINMFVKSFKFSESDIEINVDMKKIETITNIKDFFSMAGLNFETEKARQTKDAKADIFYGILNAAITGGARGVLVGGDVPDNYDSVTGDYVRDCEEL